MLFAYPTTTSLIYVYSVSNYSFLVSRVEFDSKIVFCCKKISQLASRHLRRTATRARGTDPTLWMIWYRPNRERATWATLLEIWPIVWGLGHFSSSIYLISWSEMILYPINNPQNIKKLKGSYRYLKWSIKYIYILFLLLLRIIWTQRAIWPHSSVIWPILSFP